MKLPEDLILPKWDTLFFMLFFIIFISCKDQPTIIHPIIEYEEFKESSVAPTTNIDEHQVVIQDILQATSYTYLNVTEDNNSFWIAIPKEEVEKGHTYYYKDGVEMRNFESTEHNRIFETLYLVNGISKTPIISGKLIDSGHSESEDPKIVPQGNSSVEGGTSLISLFEDPQKYDGKVIIVKGKCVKVNNQIMNRNWVHLQDGGTSDKGVKLDLTITTNEEISVGSIVIFKGKITINKDFGSGYKYEVIMEEAVSL